MNQRRSFSPIAVEVDWVDDGLRRQAYDDVTPPHPLTAERVAEMLGLEIDAHAEDEDEIPTGRHEPESGVTPVALDRSLEGSVDPRVARATAAYQKGELAETLAICEAVLRDDPSNVDARLYAVSCREILSDSLLTRLGGPRRVPYVVPSRGKIHEIALDPRTAFVLSLVDGYYSLEEIADMSGMAPHETYRLIEDLKQRGVIGLD
jgi:hypothetical protein